MEIIQAEFEQESLAKSLWELFLHDLSEFTDESWLGDDGEWQPPWGPWERPQETATRKNEPQALQTLILRVEDRPAGCATVAFAPRIYMSPGREISMAGFFILKGYRRRGIGRQFAHALFDRFPGKWEVGYLEENVIAKRFWNTIVADYTNGNVIQAPVHFTPDTEPTLGLHFSTP